MIGYLLTVLACIAAFSPEPGLAISLFDTIKGHPFSKAEGKRVFLHPNSPVLASGDTSTRLQLYSVPQDLISQHLYGLGLDPNISLHMEEHKPFYHDGREEYRFTFLVEGMKICEHSVKAHLFDHGNPIITGTFPLAQPSRFSYPASLWLPLQEILSITKESSTNFVSPELLNLNHASRCLYAFDGDLVPVWKLLVSYMGLNYAIYRDSSDVYKFEKRFYQVIGKTNSYLVNPTDPSGLVTERFELNGDSYLNSAKITTKPNGVDRISSEDHEFIVDPEDEQFPEVNVFSQVSRMIKWFEDNGFLWREGEVLTLKTNESIETGNGPNPNNALYLPREFDDPDVPSIALGNGDGVNLTNLALDADVSGHELGHHVIFQSVKSTQQVETEDGRESRTDHSGAIHEGLADFFMFAKTGNSCLGETICPGSGAICSQKGQCLRNAENTMSFGSDEYWSIGNQLYHLKGQLVSGLLWDIRSEDSVDAQEFSKLVIKAVDFLDTRSTYSNLLLALVTADNKFHGGKYACTIVEKAKSRGFESKIDAIIPDCNNFNPDGVLTNEESNTSASNSDDEEESDAAEIKKAEPRPKPKTLCGTLSKAHNNSLGHPISALLFIFLFALPLIIAQSIQILSKK